MDQTVRQFKALGDPNRFRILMMLRARPLCVCELLSVLDIAGGTLSNHLKVLENAGLISHKKDGKWIEYFISEKDTDRFLRIIETRIFDAKQIEEDRRRINTINRSVCSTGSGS